MSVLINDEISSSIDYWRLFSCSVTFQEEIRLNEPPSNTKVKCSLHFTFLELANRPCLTIPNFLSVIKDDYRRHFQFFLAIDKYNWWFYSIVLRKKKKSTYYHSNIIIENWYHQWSSDDPKVYFSQNRTWKLPTYSNQRLASESIWYIIHEPSKQI